MSTNSFTRRVFIKNSSLTFLFLLNSCSYESNEVKIALQRNFYPKFFIDTLPNAWKKENINLGETNSNKNIDIILDSDLTLVNDGWVNYLNFKEFKNINAKELLKKLDRKSINFLNTFEEYQRYKLFPIGVVPYAIVIKNNKDLINAANKSWDFLLSKKLTGKIIFPQSPRVNISIAEKINSTNSLSKLKNQAMLFDDRNALNWLINSEASVAILPYSLCWKYLKFDSRLSIVFPNQGVPLMWHFILARSDKSRESLIRWIRSLESNSNTYKLRSQGWFLPFENENLKYNANLQISNGSLPSQLCWDNSWSFPVLSNYQKIKLENHWNESLIP